MSEEDQVRRLLADARHDEPIPPDVAGRMDRVLADLAGDRPVGPAVADLDAARRRRRVRTLLVAAAAVVVAGIGVDQLRHLGSGPDGAAGGSSADSVAVQDRPENGSGAGAGGATASAPQPQAFADAPRVDPEHFARQVARLRGVVMAGYLAQDKPHHATNDLDSIERSAGCVVPGRGRRVAVRYDGAPAILVYRPVRGDTQVVDLFVCGRRGPVRSVTLPAP